MPQTFDSARLRHQKAMDMRLTADHRDLAQRIAGLVLRAATGRDATGQPIIPASRSGLDSLKQAVWEQVLKPYYVGPGTDALKGPAPQSPFALLLVEGIARATRIQAERQAAIVRRLVKDPVVLAWLTGPRPSRSGLLEMQTSVSGRITELTSIRLGQSPVQAADRLPGTATANTAANLVRPRGMYEPFHLFVDPNGYRLSDRVWQTSINVRSRVDRMMDYHVANGTSAVRLARMLQPYLTGEAAESKTITPYGSKGSYAARRLARTEIAAAAGRATVNASIANPFVGGIRWRLSGSHPKDDPCDINAHGGPNEDGVYAPERVPSYPEHPHCLCSLLPVPIGSTADLVSDLRTDIQAAKGYLSSAAGAGGNAQRARALEGILNPAYLTRAILSGSLEEAIVSALGALA